MLIGFRGGAVSRVLGVLAGGLPSSYSRGTEGLRRLFTPEPMAHNALLCTKTHP